MEYIKYFFQKCVQFLISLRYRVKITGLEDLDFSNTEEGGFLFLPNHPTYVIDPAIISAYTLEKAPVRPVVLDMIYYLPFFNFFMRQVDAVPIPSFSITTNTHKLRRMNQALQVVIDGLENGENFIFYPAGKLKITSKEQIGGASGLHKILQETKKYRVVLVRITGLWGSSFSRCDPEHPPEFLKTSLQGIKMTLKNLLFFNPRRDVLVEFVQAPADFPAHGDRAQQNRWLENWYNRTGPFAEPGVVPGEPLYLVRRSIWSKELPKIQPRLSEEEVSVDLEKVPGPVRQKVMAKLAEMSGVPVRDIHPKMSLNEDLGIDSLDASEMSLFLEDHFQVKDVPADEITTVKRILGVASGQIQVQQAVDMNVSKKTWRIPEKKKIVSIPKGDSVIEVFLRNARRQGSNVACVDQRSGIMTYSQLKTRVVILAEYIKKFEGEYIGILLPSSAAAMMATLAVLLARKTPVMVNWTVGPRHINSVVEQTGMQVCLSSWAFLDRLSNTDLGVLVDRLFQLEDLREIVTLKDKLRGYFTSLGTTKSILSKYGKTFPKEEDTAVILFTSGSEGVPKGVPLSNKNVLSNLKSVSEAVDLYENDVLLSILPPFHSFGFTVSGMAPLLSGLKALFYPNPTDGSKIAKLLGYWKATILCGAPSFIKNILRASTKEMVKSLRLIVTGAEKAPPELFRQMEALGLGDKMLEGYGITECSPVLTLNRLEEEKMGVGRALPRVDLLVVDPQSYEELKPHEQGLVLATGPNIFAGYLNSDKDPFIEKYGVKWYQTGDLGFLDNKGRLTLTGRQKRFIKVGPEMISLAAIEEALLEGRQENWPDPKEGPILAVVAQENPGEKPYVILFTTFLSSTEEMNKILKQQGFSNLVRVNKVHQLASIPLMGSGKVFYRQLEQEFLT